MNNTNVTEQQIVEVKNIREKYIENIEVLNKVKKLFLIPEMEVMTTKMVADYYEVGFDTIQTCYNKNKDEIQKDGVIKRKLSDFNESVLKKDSYIKSKTGISFKVDNYEIVIPNCGILCFSQRAVLRIGMLLRDSVIAKEIRTQLLNIFENSTEEQKVTSIDEEMILQANVGKAYMSGNIEEFAKASMEYNVFQNRYKIKIQNENVQLTKINKNLECENDLLTLKTMQWGNKPVLNALMRAFALKCLRGTYRYSEAWNLLYKQVKYKYGYDIPNRKTADKMIDRIKDNEFPEIIATAVSLLKNSKVDVGKIINEINLSKINE